MLMAPRRHTGQLALLLCLVACGAVLAAPRTLSAVPASVQMQTGTETTQTIDAIQTKDQSGPTEEWLKYREYHPAGTAGCVGDITFQALPSDWAGTDSGSFLTNFYGESGASQVWEFHAYSYATSSWVLLGTNAAAGASWTSWTELAFALPAPASQFLDASFTAKARISTPTGNAEVCLIDVFQFTFVETSGTSPPPPPPPPSGESSEIVVDTITTTVGTITDQDIAGLRNLVPLTGTTDVWTEYVEFHTQAGAAPNHVSDLRFPLPADYQAARIVKVKLTINYMGPTPDYQPWSWSLVRNDGTPSAVGSNAAVSSAWTWTMVEEELEQAAGFADYETAGALTLRVQSDTSVDVCLFEYVSLTVTLAADPPCTVPADCPVPADTCMQATCTDGFCGEAPISCPDTDGDACTVPTCDAGVCVEPRTPGCCSSDAECADDSACTNDACVGNVCVSTPVLCNDNSTCTLDSCNATIGCVYTPISCDDADACTTDSCDAVTGCVNAPVSCDDADACTADSCDASTGCVNVQISCDDGVACTIDSCDAVTGCVNAPQHDSCDDSNACTLDQCGANGCVNTGIANCCQVDADCGGLDACFPATCVNSTCVVEPVMCVETDGDACTLPGCSNGVCVETAIAGCCNDVADCDDSDACTADACNSGTCVHSMVSCSDTNACTTDSCDAVDGCRNVQLDCDDGNACTTDSCDPGVGCVHTPITCDDGIACTLDACDVATGACTSTPDASLCDDNNPCTSNRCSGVDGCSFPAILCDDGVSCTSDSCDDNTGACVASPDDSACDDNDVCTTDACDSTLGCSHSQISCDDNVACTVDACDPVTGCSHSPNDSACDDEDDCTTDECTSTGCSHSPINSFACSGGCTDPSQCYDLGVRVLVISPGTNVDWFPGLPVIKQSLEAFGIPYDVLIPANGALELFDSNGKAKYNGIALVSGGLATQPWNQEYPGTFASALSPSQWNDLRSYARTYSVRVFSMSSNPEICDIDADPVESYAATSMQFASSPAFVPSGMALSASWALPAQHVRHWHTSFPGAGNVSPLVRFADDSVAAAVCSFDAGEREELHFFFENAVWTEYSVGLTPIWVDWLVKGVYLGERRVYLLCQIDDWFLSTQVWNVAERRPALEHEFAYLSRGPELAWHAAWQADLNARLPAGSNVTLTFAYNGQGVYDDGGPGASQILPEMLAWRDQFRWLSHTFTHPHLDAMSYPAVLKEMLDNVDIKNDYLFPDPAERAEYHSDHAMVTPSISGLFSQAALQAIWDAEVYSTVGDNSRGELIPSTYGQSLYHAIITSQTVNNFAGMMIIPRWPTWIMYDASTPEENMSEYHAYNGPNCNQPGCFNNHPSTMSIQELWEQEATTFVPYLLAYRHDPYMFHQANVRVFSLAGGQTSLVAGWVEAVLDKYLQFSTLPVKTLKQQDLAHSYRRRMDRDACGLSAFIKVRDGQAIGAEINGTGCLASFSGAADSSYDVESYGPDVTTHVPVGSGVASVLDFDTPVQWI